MSRVSHVPAKTETVVVAPEKFALELSRDDAEKVLALMGLLSIKGVTSNGLYDELRQAVWGLADSYFRAEYVISSASVHGEFVTELVMAKNPNRGQ